MIRSVPRSRRHSPLKTFFLGLLALPSAAALVPLIILPLAWKEQAIFGAALIGIGILLNSASRSLTVTMVLMTISVFSTLRYGYWRVTQTCEGITSAGHLHHWDTAFVLMLLAAEFFAFSTLILGYFQTLRPLKRPPLPLEGNPADWPTVDVLIPTYNEPLHVVKGTVLAARALDYPANKMRVLLLDDGRRPEFRQFAAQAGVEYVTRNDNAHAKAGNINHALEHLSGEFVAIFDCDHVPSRSFLRMTLGWFLRDRGLGLLQTPHQFYSPDPFERNLGQFRTVPNEGELFHRLVQDGNDLWNASFFCGSCAVLRRSALDEIGGIAVETVTEDAHTALRMQRRGWNTAYLNIPLAAGLATESLAAHIGQRIRWARGMTQILRVENPLFASGLSFPQRLCYFNATTHFLFAVPRLIFLTVPLVYLLFGKVNIYGYTWAILAYAFPHLVLSTMTNSRVQGRHRHSFWNEIYEVVLAPYILFPTLLALINPRLGKFNVTSKGGILRRSYFDRRIALPYLFLLALNISGLVMAERRFVADPAHRDTIIMNGVWTLYSTMILSVAASVAWERRQLRAGASLRAKLPVKLKLDPRLVSEGPSQIDGTTVLLSRNGAMLKVEEPVELARGGSVLLAIGEGSYACQIPALVAHSAGRNLHLFLPELTAEQVDQIERMTRSRRRAWRALHSSHSSDRPLRSLVVIFLLAIRGIVMLPFGFFTPAPATEEDPLPSRRKGRATSFVAPILLFGCILLPLHTKASDLETQELSPTKQAAAVQTANFHDQFELGVAGETKNLSLKGSGASLSFFFGEPVNKVTTDAVLRLSYAAPDLKPSEAHLEVTLNGAAVGTIILLPGESSQTEFTLPTDLLTNENTLSFRLQGTCDSCARATWVMFNPASTVIMSGTRLPLANDLSLLPLPFFDPSGLHAWSLPVVFGDAPDESTLEGASLVASWLGVLSDVRGVHFPVTVGEFPNGNAVVFAVRGSSLLAGLSLPAGSGPLLAMRDNPHDPYGKLLIVTGDTSDDVLNASRALTNQSHMPHAASLRVPTVLPAGRPVYSAPRWLQADQPSAIGAYTTEERLKLQGTGSLNLYFRLPPDLFLRSRQSVPLLLKFRYNGIPQGSQAALHVRLNGRDIDTIQLKPASTPVEEQEVMRLPTGSMLTYTNTLTVDFYFEHGAPPEGTRQSLAIHRDSTIDLSGLPHSVVLPRLELFADAGYPFTEWPDLSRTAVIMPNHASLGEYETLLDMAGFFGAQTGALANRLTVAGADHPENVQDKDLVVIGTPQSQPLLSEWSASMPLAFSDPGMHANESPATTLFMHPEWPFREYDGVRLNRLAAGNPGLDAILESFVSPLRKDRVVVAIDPSGSDPMPAIRALFTPSERQGPVYGGVAVSRNGRFDSFLVGTQAYHNGELDRVQYGTVFLIEDYWLIPLLVLALTFVIVAWVRWLTERVAERRLATWET
ncbi:MAG TPA: UDP-forming cellulose synthase catalytic subunit [Terracidiphilus sp.]|nr:UDP-forming cellulose synthase catalytic subunit [Terracidiphilus sp.]